MTLDPMELLDILGNENRRRILQLLSFRPFYFNEMAKRLDVGPKAVIDHLEMLERAGLIECYQDQGRRKYFRIARKTVLEVAVSPHSYGVRAFCSEDAPRARTDEMAQDMKQLSEELNTLEDKRRELRGMLDKIESRENGDQADRCQCGPELWPGPAGVGESWLALALGQIQGIRSGTETGGARDCGGGPAEEAERARCCAE